MKFVTGAVTDADVILYVTDTVEQGDRSAEIIGRIRESGIPTVVLINKIDVMPYFDFDLEQCKKNILMRNPNAKIIPICAKTGEGMEEWADWLKKETAAWKEEEHA